MKKFALGFAAGVAVTYFADPNRGRRRRAILRDKVTAACRDVEHEMDKGSRDLKNRTRGLAAMVRSAFRNGRAETDGAVLVERVRTALGRAVGHPRAIRTRCDGGGRIVLEGSVLRDEVDYLFRTLESVPGVTQIVSRLEIFNDGNGVSSLQGGVRRKHVSEIAQDNWTPALRLATAAVAAGAFSAALRSEGSLRWAGALGGVALLARAILNKPLERIVGMDGAPEAVHFVKTIHIDAPVEEVYAYWTNFENFPRFMTHLKEVRNRGNGRWHWVAEGPAGIPIPWDARIVEQRENQLLTWNSLPGSVIRTRGLVRFDEEPDGITRVSIRMSYCPVAGVFGHAAAWLFGADPKSEMDDDLVRLKSLIEIGRTRAHGVRVTRDEAPVPAAGS